MSLPDVLVIGGGIVGAACALELAREGHRVEVLERGFAGCGTTATAMGHIIVLHDSQAQFRLTRWSQELWSALADELPPQVEVDRCGCIWIASEESQMDWVRDKAALYRSHGIQVDVLDSLGLAQAEPSLRPNLAGGLRMREDLVLYPPAAARWLVQRAVDAGATIRTGVSVRRVSGTGATLDDGSTRAAGCVVDAAGTNALELLPEPIPGLQIRPRKGHLAITDRGPRRCWHQLAEIGYLASAHTHAQTSVAFNVQPRRTGQVLVGSSRQYGRHDTRVEPEILARMLRRAIEFIPALAQMRVTRTWTGLRPATDDRLPLIGPVPGFSGLYLATGHEGLGITTSLGTGRLIADMVAGRSSAIDPAPYRLERCLGTQA